MFNGAMARFPSALFSSLGDAESWIRRNKLTGVLTKYPVDKSAYDWAVENDFFIPKEGKQKSSDFIGGFTCAAMEHYHYENGNKE
ncbi:DUF7710 domain-containing protein [Rahnella woolbedingensis]|uniref:DUF7710 domain-containing protein n=1 Tax=Rahnella woolbedingensis TaxID=1510574 RepID=UPI001FC91055|nr:hypothetical protein [Rahnella woolbedingensis]